MELHFRILNIICVLVHIDTILDDAGPAVDVDVCSQHVVVGTSSYIYI